MKYNLEKIWELIENQPCTDSYQNRVYRRLDSDKETGIRLGIVNPGKIREILIEINPKDEKLFTAPQWTGMKFEIILLETPMKTKHIRLFLSETEHKSVFSRVCMDIVDTLLKIKNPRIRFQEFQNCIERWDYFFKRYGTECLSPEMQRGLFGELSWLKQILTKKMDSLYAVRSWKGFKREFHDFQYKNGAVEVKTTITKEPRKVRINSERQLNNEGFDFLYLFILTLQKMESGSQSLPELIDEIRYLIKGKKSSENIFEAGLRSAGFLDIHSASYNQRYNVIRQEIFEVKSNFPRITVVPEGVGDINYTITLSACSKYLKKIDLALKNFIRGKT
jgi:hypothetical protein